MFQNHKMKQRIVIPGGNGFIGKYLSDYFAKRNFSVIVLSRKPGQSKSDIEQCYWDGKNQGAWSKYLEGAKAVINLSGKSVNCRYNTKNKTAILNSREDSTRVIAAAIDRCATPPEVWINAASATIYQHTTSGIPNDEINGKIGQGFSVDVCRRWEETFFNSETPSVRKVALRSAITLGRDGGALPPMRWLTRLALGGKQGNGKQYISWIHIEDLARITEWCISNKEVGGIINCSAPYPVQNAAFMQTLRKVTGHVIGLPAPVWLLDIGAFFIGTETELLLKSRKVISRRLPDMGFEFKFPELERALLDLTRGWS